MALARIGRFEIERRLGSGSFATVWLARDEDLEAWVAIKVLADNWSHNEDARRRFLEEARALRQLDNDRIVRVYEVGRLDDDRPYMVMEYADRGTLEDRLRLRRNLGRPFSVREALEHSVEMAECLAAVHASRILHRDIKPSNVLFRSVPGEAQETLRRLGRPAGPERTLLGDFGIARRLEGMLGHTLVLGSPDYMAPEQADPARAGDADERSDVYSAAVVLFELLTGRLPHRFESVGDLPRLADDMAPPRIERIRPDVSPRLGEVVRGGLARDPDHRYGSAWEWRDALRSALAEAAADEEVSVSVVGTGARPVARSSPASTTVPTSGRAGSTLPARTRIGTRRLSASFREVPAPPDRPDPGAWVAQPPPSTSMLPEGIVPGPPVRLRLPGAGAMAASLAALVGTVLPWRVDARGTAFGQSRAIAVASAVLFLCGIRLWQTRRRWAAILAAGICLGIGGAGVLFAPITMIAVGGQGSGLGLLIVAAAAALGSGYLALGRLRRDPRLWLASRAAPPR